MATDLKKQCAAEIKKLLPNISATDRKEALLVLRISQPTLIKYLRGEISDIDRALEVIEFFRGKVDGRLAQLERA